MIWWRTRRSPDTPTEWSIQSLLKRTETKQMKISVDLRKAFAWIQLRPCSRVTSCEFWVSENVSTRKSFKVEVSDVLFFTLLPLSFRRSAVWWKPFCFLYLLRWVNGTSAPRTDSSSCMHSTLKWHERSQCPRGAVWGNVDQGYVKSSNLIHNLRLFSDK